MSIMVGTGRGAEAGVLIRDAEALEILEKVTTLVVDKTGTLTEGRPALVTVASVSDGDETTILSLAAGLEQASEHPLAAAIVAGAAERTIAIPKVSNFSSVTGQGVTGVVDGRKIAIGSRAHLDALGVEASSLADRAEALRREGQTVLFVAIDGHAAGLLGVADRIKPTTSEAIRALKQGGMLSSW